ncbi:MAG: 30S ribosomal protein S2 [bacterium]|nr:30S ribosomal protein S2 [bacterium]
MSISVEEMIKHAVHFGHRRNKWNPKMKPYIYGEVNGIHFFDLEKTVKKLQELLDYLKEAATLGKNILFVSTKPQTMEMITRIAKIHNSPCVTKKWLGGLLTNFDTMKERIRTFKNLKDQKEAGEFAKYTKKEASQFQKDIEKFETALGGIQDMRKIPDVLFVVDGHRDLIAVKEARKLRIPVVGLCDSNADPDLYTIFVPANDDAMKSLTYILGLVEEVLTSAKKPASIPTS